MSNVRIVPLLLLLAACTNQQASDELRLVGPLKQGFFARNYKELADCVTHAVAGKYDVDESVQEELGVARITDFIYLPQGGQFPMWLLEIKRRADGHSNAEVHAASTPKTNFLPADLWPIVETCGKAA
jgi:hypothetical protein